MHDDRRVVESRIDRTIRERVKPAVHPLTVPLAVESWTCPGEPVPVADGLAAPYQPAAVGDPWGAPWGTTWFRFTGEVPAEWAGRAVEAIVDLGFGLDQPGFSAEGLVYRPDGTPVLLEDQDRRRWDRAAIRRGRAALAAAGWVGRGLCPAIAVTTPRERFKLSRTGPCSM